MDTAEASMCAVEAMEEATHTDKEADSSRHLQRESIKVSTKRAKSMVEFGSVTYE